MHREIPELSDRAVPRYTSYPTAAEFGDTVGAVDQAQAVAAAPMCRPVSLYVHIPYCRQICSYCGCNTGALTRVERLEAYLDALAGEIATVGRVLRAPVGSVHFGGGTPNVLSPDQVRRLGETLRGHFRFTEDAHWAVEIDPRDFSAADARAFADIGVRRVSIGAQTFSPVIQARIGRLQPFRRVAEAVADTRRAGIERINLDLMYGLPGQGMDDIAATIAAALTLAPDRIAMFGYAHMPRLLPRQRMIDATQLPDAHARFWQSALAHDLLTEAGYEAIGFDHFALPGDSLTIAAREGRLRRNFQGFTDDPADTLIGLGASAISQFDGLIVQNEKHVGRYRMLAANGRFAGMRGVRRDGEDQMRGAVIERLLCDGHVDVAGISANEALLDELVDLGVITRRGGRVAVTPAGRPYARIAASAFDSYRQGITSRFSRAV